MSLFFHSGKVKSRAVIAYTCSYSFQFLARNVNGFAQWYATSIYRILVTIISRVCSVFPFSIVEILLYVLLVVLAAGVMRGIYRICRKTEKASTIALKGSSWVCLLVGGLFLSTQ